MYWIDKYSLGRVNEYELKWIGKNGAKGEKRQPRSKPTPEQIERHNQKLREKRMRRLLLVNFQEGDYWCTLTYPAGTRKPAQEVKADLRRFLDSIKRKYKRLGDEFKFIYRMEIGKRGGIHIHMVLPKSSGETASLVQSSWKPGRVYFTTLDSGTYEKLACYIVKPLPDEVSIKEDERSQYVKYSSSRNLIRPEPERKFYTRRTAAKLVRDGPTPSPGFEIIKNSVHHGVSLVSGYSYMHYSEVKIEGKHMYSDHGKKHKPHGAGGGIRSPIDKKGRGKQGRTGPEHKKKSGNKEGDIVQGEDKQL